MAQDDEANLTGMKRIAVTGPESTGKSWLASHLASFYHCLWVPEYSRAYLKEIGRKYTLHDILLIAKGQKEEEETAQRKSEDRSLPYLFCDTEPIVTKIWSEHVFHKSARWIINEIDKHPYDLYLLCYIDLPWEPDPLREHPDLREYLFQLYRNELSARNLPYFVIKGDGQDRLQNAIQAIEKYFGSNPCV